MYFVHSLSLPLGIFRIKTYVRKRKKKAKLSYLTHKKQDPHLLTATYTANILQNRKQYIGNYAFSNNQLTQLTLPSSVTNLSDYIFNDNENLASVTFDCSLSVSQTKMHVDDTDWYSDKNRSQPIVFPLTPTVGKTIYRMPASESYTVNHYIQNANGSYPSIPTTSEQLSSTPRDSLSAVLCREGL